MCLNLVHSKYQYKCAIIGIVSLILHILILCFTITVMMLGASRNTSDILQRYHNPSADIYFGNMDRNQFFGLSGITLASVIGIVTSVMLIIGSRYKKSCCLVIYICYASVISILLFITAILLFLSVHWKFAITASFLAGLSCNGALAVIKYNETMVQDEAQNIISDLTLLIETDSEDIPVESGA